MNKNLAILALLIAAIAVAITVSQIHRENPNLDSFAKCLAKKDITMYGAEWCAHCQKEKNAFGASFQFVPYVECPENPKKCVDLGIEVFPTWIFPDGRRFIDEQGIKKLSELSGCPIK